LHGELAILWCGPGERQFLVAINKKTGEKVWQHDVPGGKYGSNPKEWIGTWTTPIVIRAGERDELIVNVPGQVVGFDPKTGKQLWSCSGLSKLSYTSPVCTTDGVIVAMSGYHGPGLAVRAGGGGDVTKSHRLWLDTEKPPQRIGSAVIVGEHA